MSKDKLVVIGLNDVEHKRIALTLEKHFREPLRRYEYMKEALPKLRDEQKAIIDYIGEQLKVVPEDSVLNKYLLEQKKQYEVDYENYLTKEENKLAKNEHYTEKAKAFDEYLGQFITVKDNVITYDKEQLLIFNTLLSLIDIFDLDDKLKEEQEEKTRLLAQTPTKE